MTNALSSLDKKILSVLQWNARIGLPDLAKQIKSQEHSVRYALSRLRDSGLVRYSPIIDIYKLGLQQHTIVLSLISQTPKERQNFIKEIVDDPSVTFFAELGGEYPFAISILGSSIICVDSWLRNLTSRFGAAVERRKIATILKITDFSVSLTLAEHQERKEISWEFGADLVQIDELDGQILGRISEADPLSNEKIARELGIPVSTLKYRLKRLEGSGVLLCYRYLIDTTKLGFHRHNLGLRTKGVSTELDDKMRIFCRASRSVRYLTRSVGAWDYDLGIEVREPKEVAHFNRELQSLFEGALIDQVAVPVFHFHKVNQYPLSGKSAVTTTIPRKQ